MTEHPGNAPVAATPPRRAASIRRTTTHDSNRPEGLDGLVAHVASGRDLLTDVRGQAIVLDEARIEATVDYNRVAIIGIASQPPEPALAALAGKGAYSGFRKSIEDLLPGEVGSHTIRAQLFDDFPAAVMGNGRALRAEGVKIAMARKNALPVDLCAGWAEGGTLVSGYSDLGPPLLVGPRSPALAGEHDPLAWHAFAPLAAHGTRRARRTDLWEEDGLGRADCFFRDSHVDRHGVETVIHEWRLLVAFDPDERRFVSVSADAGPLPYPECPASGGSAARLAGMSIDGLRREVRRSFVGPSTCTHLNDTFRALEDIGMLFDRLAAIA
ncbi:Protein of unknown function [Novosphingobium sp. CF614]|uniref:DUF2889 domain-containing protein n=1 Tax=Novosphingobium sp. CF614 TaxID=1884364 RepID=UPI0008ED3189|nr:DUF2889 domain-containing protein [Novosphingobium sp. CF614]SFF96552.1 Protein of unknown function [Novosphingobium sp. CF614]